MENGFVELIQSIAHELFPQHTAQSHELVQEMIKRFESEFIFSLEQLQFMKHEHYRSCKISIGLEAKFRQKLHERNFLSIFSPTSTPILSPHPSTSLTTSSNSTNGSISNDNNTTATTEDAISTLAKTQQESTPVILSPVASTDALQTDKPITTDGWIHYAEELKSVIPKNATKHSKTKPSKRKQPIDEIIKNKEEHKNDRSKIDENADDQDTEDQVQRTKRKVKYTRTSNETPVTNEASSSVVTTTQENPIKSTPSLELNSNQEQQNDQHSEKALLFSKLKTVFQDEKTKSWSSEDLRTLLQINNVEDLNPMLEELITNHQVKKVGEKFAHMDHVESIPPPPKPVPLSSTTIASPQPKSSKPKFSIESLHSNDTNS